jgi:hypothetical protein
MARELLEAALTLVQAIPVVIKRVFSGLACSSAILSGACSSEVPEAAAPSRAGEVRKIGAACPTGAVPAAPGAPLRVFIEVALLDYDTRLAPSNGGPVPASLADDPRVLVRWTSHLLALDDAPSTLAIGPGAAASRSDCDADARRITVTPHLDAAALAPNPALQLEIVIDAGATAATGSEGACPGARGARTTVVVDNQRSIFLAAEQKPKGRPRGVFSVTPYLVRSDAELEQIQSCKGMPGSSSR